MGKSYKTAGGKTIDMEALIAKNEDVRAVGNMHVNAKGDVIDSENKVTSSRSTQVNKSYRKQIGNVAKDVPVAASLEDITKPEEIVGLDEPVVESEPVEAPKPKTKRKTRKKAAAPKTGLAAAIAKTQEGKE